MISNSNGDEKFLRCTGGLGMAPVWRYDEVLGIADAPVYMDTGNWRLVMGI
jgi:hypothetical protein